MAKIEDYKPLDDHTTRQFEMAKFAFTQLVATFALQQTIKQQRSVSAEEILEMDDAKFDMQDIIKLEKFIELFFWPDSKAAPKIAAAIAAKKAEARLASKGHLVDLAEKSTLDDLKKLPREQMQEVLKGQDEEKTAFVVAAKEKPADKLKFLFEQHLKLGVPITPQAAHLALRQAIKNLNVDGVKFLLEGSQLVAFAAEAKDFESVEYVKDAGMAAFPRQTHDSVAIIALLLKHGAVKISETDADGFFKMSVSSCSSHEAAYYLLQAIFLLYSDQRLNAMTEQNPIFWVLQRKMQQPDFDGFIENLPEQIKEENLQSSSLMRKIKLRRLKLPLHKQHLLTRAFLVR